LPRLVAMLIWHALVMAAPLLAPVAGVVYAGVAYFVSSAVAAPTRC